MKTTFFCLFAALTLAGCTNDPVTNYQWAQFANGLAGGAAQQQAASDADFYYRQQQLQQANQAQQLQNIADKMPANQNSSGWW
ncbi:hypothetical protein [Pseudomonas sp. BF-R-21]|uniref:hypothetical protein n=1 Tax=Pseudomonas sp. BF-R-21 TaxID=2832387 RepID=UPI001CBBC504|nr:hypothetical protein [Pseudomonas sp. BF-R-21]